MNNGDDCLIICSRKHEKTVRSQFPAFCQNLGFQMKLEATVDTLEQIEFCQTHPVFDGSAWRMVRNFATALSKDAMFLKPIGDRNSYENMLATVGDCGMALACGLPVIQ